MNVDKNNKELQVGDLVKVTGHKSVYRIWKLLVSNLVHVHDSVEGREDFQFIIKGEECTKC